MPECGWWRCRLQSWLPARRLHRGLSLDRGRIHTIAGNGTGGYNGDGISATSAEIDFTIGVTVDKNDNVVLGDADNNRVRLIAESASNPGYLLGGCAGTCTWTVGDIYTIAGDGTGGYNGDGIPATSAELSSPNRVAFDTDGNLYIGDVFNNRLRKVEVQRRGRSTTLYVAQGGTGTTCSGPALVDACPTITAAVAVASSGDTIDVGSGTITDNVVIPGSLTDLSIKGSTSEDSTTISGGGSGPVFWIQGGASATISNLSIIDGTTSTPSTYSGGIYNAYQGTVTLDDDTVSDNSDSGIGNYGSLQMVDSTVSKNYGTGFGNYADATVTHSTFSGNTADTPSGGAGNGGAIQNGGYLTLLSDTIASNSAGVSGGEIFNYDSLAMAGTIIGPNSSGKQHSL